MKLPEIYKKLEAIEFPGKQPVMNKLKVVIAVLERDENTRIFLRDPNPKFVIRSEKEPVRAVDEDNKVILNKPKQKP